MLSPVMDQIVNGLESHFMTAVVVSGAVALLIVAGVAFVWWRSRHAVERGRAYLATARHTALFTQTDDPPPMRPAGGSSDPADEPPPVRPASGGSSAGGDEQLGSRLVREAAARAAALRDAWDRSYREARGSTPAPPSDRAASASVSDAPTVLDDLLREQRETNALLRQLLERLGPPQT